MIYGLILIAFVYMWMYYEIKHPMIEQTEVSEGESGFEVDVNGNLVETKTVIVKL